MPTPTYDLIQEQVLGSNTATVTFSTIPGTYKDVVVEIIATNTDSNPRGTYMRFNGDTGTNYSVTMLNGNGTAASSRRFSNETVIYADFFGSLPASGTTPNTNIIHVMSYANTNVNKTCLIRAGRAAGGTDAIVGLWRSTSAITSIAFTVESAFSFASGSTFRLWGVSG